MDQRYQVFTQVYMNEGMDVTDLSSPGVVADPYPYFTWLREHDPVHWNQRHGAWLISSYDEVHSGFRDPARLSSNRLKEYRRKRLTDDERATLDRSFAILESWMVFQDEPDHRRLRGIVKSAFSRSRLAAIEEEIGQVVSEQVAQLRQRLRGDPDLVVDLLNDFAYAIPATVICRMLGVPDRDQESFIGWSDDLIAVISGEVGLVNRNERAHRAVVNLHSYLTERIEDGRRSESGGLLRDLVTAEEDGQTLTQDEVIATAILLLFAGHRTSACMLANGFHALMSNPDQYTALLHDLEAVPNAVEEFLRWEGHTKLSVRMVSEDFEWGGRVLHAGQRVFLLQLAANRDPSVFPEPDRLDVTRENANRHVGFGNGIHFCLGAPLARMEMRIAFREMLTKLPPVKRVGDGPDWLPTLISRTQRDLPVRFG